jgi:hypothetical protein
MLEGTGNKTVIAIVVAAVIGVIGVVAFAALTRRDNQPAPQAGPAAPTTVTLSPSAPATSAPASAPPATPTSPAPAVAFRFQPLWPFNTLAEVEAWQHAYRSGGQQPWHLDPEATALGFTTGYLGFTGIKQVVATELKGDEAWVEVGYPIENRRTGVAAALHLARYGTGADAPWVVVGSRDTTLTLTEPSYGSMIGSPVKVGGRITGVDESIRVQVRQLSSPAPLGEYCCLPAGGENTPWSATVEFGGASGAPLTIVASTGGHVADVERFAITGVRPAR